jgi:hypothetical protein
MRAVRNINVGGFPWRDCRGSIKQANSGVWGTNLNFLSRFDGGVVRTNHVGLFCSIALIQAKLKEFFDRAGATDCLFEIRLGYLRSLWSSHCEWLISASRSIL